MADSEAKIEDKDAAVGIPLSMEQIMNIMKEWDKKMIK